MSDIDKQTPAEPAPDQPARCFWVDGSDIYRTYHDHEWGYPVTDDVRLFEKICLEGFQAGLSWITILKKRENFRAAFAGFDFHKVARFDESDVEKLLQDAGIIRHRGKIEAAINNAHRAIEMEREFGSLRAYFWQYENDVSARPKVQDEAYMRTLTTSAEAIVMSKDLKKRGWKFVGPTTMYAFMQAMGLVNDHQSECHVRERVREARAALQL